MAATLTTTQVTCPMHKGSDGPLSCHGEQVNAHGLADFHTTSVKVDACSSLTAQGWTGPQWVGSKTHAIDYLLPASTVTVWRHRDGLVAFSA